MNSIRYRINRLRLWGIRLIMGCGMMCFGSIIHHDNYAFALDKTSIKTTTQIKSATSIDSRPLLAFVKAMGAFDNAPKGDKVQLQAKYQDLQRLSPGFIGTAKAVVQELKAKGHWATVDQFLYTEAAKDRLPAQLMEEVKSAGGPKVILENIGRFIDEDLKNRLQRTAMSKQSFIIDAFGFIGTAHAGTGCSIGAWGANGIMKVFGWVVGKSYSSEVEAANLKYCM